MHRILEQLVIEQTVPADCVKVRLPVDENAIVPGGDITVDFLKRGQAAHGITVQISGGDKMPVSFVPGACFSEERSQSIVRFGEARFAGQ